MSDERLLHFTKASAIAMRPVHWLWLERLALGVLALLGGREGIGKTILSATIAAAITRGTLEGRYKNTPKSVIIVATEDSWAHTIVPRLVAAGADLDRVYQVEALTSDGISTSVTLPVDLAELKRVIKVTDAALVILDPLLSRLDSRLDTHKDADVRRALEPLSAIADETGVCLLGLIHVNKATSNDPLTTLMASRAFAAVARAVLFVMKDPDDESLRLLGQPKNNLGRTDLPTLVFRIAGVKVADTNEGEVWTGKLEWRGESARSIHDALEAASETTGDRTATSEAGDWLQDYLSGEPDHYCDSATIKREGAKAGHSIDSLKRSRKRLGITSQSVGFPRKTYWSLPVGAPQGRHITALTTLTAPTGQSEQLAQSAQPKETGDTAPTV